MWMVIVERDFEIEVPRGMWNFLESNSAIKSSMHLDQDRLEEGWKTHAVTTSCPASTALGRGGGMVS